MEQPNDQLWVIPATDSPLAVIVWQKSVIEKKETIDWVQLSLWHTDSDLFEHGQWIKARILYEWSDMSPDGSLFIHRGLKYRNRVQKSEGYEDNWVAISKPPYFTALAYWNTSGYGAEEFL